MVKRENLSDDLGATECPCNDPRNSPSSPYASTLPHALSPGGGPWSGGLSDGGLSDDGLSDGNPFYGGLFHGPCGGERVSGGVRLRLKSVECVSRTEPYFNG